MGSFCGSSPQTVISQASNPNVTAQQNQVYGLANDYAQRFGGDPSQLIAPWNQLQTSAAQGVSDASTMALPWMNIAGGMAGSGSNIAGASPTFFGAGAQNVGNLNAIPQQAWNPTPYESPFTQDVIGATRANIEQSNEVARNGAMGNLIQSGTAFGGDRAGVTMAELARNQGLAENQTIAGLEQANFNQASQQANAQQQYLLNLGLGNNSQLLQGAGIYGQLGQGMTQAGLAQGNLGMQLGNLGEMGQSGLMNAYQGLYNMGIGLQNTQQQQLSAPMTFAQWYANASPGTANVPTSTTYPGANPLSTIAGLGLAGLGGASLISQMGGLGAIFGGLLHKGGRVNKDHGGAVDPHMHDLLTRYSHIKHMLGGGVATPDQTGQVDPGQMAMQTAYGNEQQGMQAKEMPTGRQAHFMDYLRSATGIGKGGPEDVQLAVNRMQTQPASHGGRIHAADGVGIGDGGGGDGASIGSAWSAGNSDMNAPEFTPSGMEDQHFTNIMDAHKKSMKVLADAMKYLNQRQQNNNPLVAPHAPNQASPINLPQLAQFTNWAGNDGGGMESSHGGRIPHAMDGLSYDDSTGMGGADVDSGGGGGGLQALSDLYHAIDSRVRAARPEYNSPDMPAIAPVGGKTVADIQAQKDEQDTIAKLKAQGYGSQPSADLGASLGGQSYSGARWNAPNPTESTPTATRSSAPAENFTPQEYLPGPGQYDSPPQEDYLPSVEDQKYMHDPATKTSSYDEPQPPANYRNKSINDMTVPELQRYMLMKKIERDDRADRMMPGSVLMQMARMFFPHRSGVGTMDPSFGAGAEGVANQIGTSNQHASDNLARTVNEIGSMASLAQQKELANRLQFHPLTTDFGGQQPAVFNPATGTMSIINPVPAAGGTGAGASLASTLPPLPQQMDWTKKGEEFRAQLPPQWREQMEAIAQGREQMPSTSSRDQHAKMMAAMMPIAYPGFDATQWRARNDLRTDFGRGATGKQLASLDMYAQHAEELGKAIEDVNNYGLPLGNAVRNVTNPIAESLNPEGSGVRMKRLRTSGSGVGEEISKLLHGSPNVTGAEEWKHQMANETASRAEQRAINGKGADLVLGRVQALEDQWLRTMGKTREEMGEPPLISPQTRAKLQRLSGMGRYNLSPEEYDKQFGHPAAGAEASAPAHPRPVPPKVAEILQDAMKTGAPTVKLPDGREMPTKEFAQRVMQKLQSGQWVEKHGG